MVGPESKSFNVKHSSNFSSVKIISIAILLVATSFAMLHFFINPRCSTFRCEISGYETALSGDEKKQIGLEPFSLATTILKVPTDNDAVYHPNMPKQSSDLTEEAHTFVVYYWSQWSQPSGSALSFVSSTIADSIVFYGKSISRAYYLSVETKFANRWPSRRYELAPGSLVVLCNDTMASCHISGIVYWDDASIARNASSTGSAAFEFQLAVEANNGKSHFIVTEQSGKVIKRTKSSLNP